MYGDISDKALLQSVSFSALLCLIVGTYWLMRSLKDSVFASVVGLAFQPRAKMLSLLVVTAMLLIYNKLVDRLTRLQLFVIVFGAYAVVFLAVAILLSSTQCGLYDRLGRPIPPSPYRLTGWFLYFAIESYGSLSVSIFWQ